MTISHKDRLLLNVLGENARISTAELARRIGASRTTVQARLEKLERDGVVKGYSVSLADSYENGLIKAHVWITLRAKALGRVVQELKAIPATRSVHSVSGHVDLIVTVAATSIEELDGVIDGIGAIEGVERTQSSIILSTRFER